MSGTYQSTSLNSFSLLRLNATQQVTSEGASAASGDIRFFNIHRCDSKDFGITVTKDGSSFKIENLSNGTEASQKLKKDDVIKTINGVKITSMHQVQNFMHGSSKNLIVSVERSGIDIPQFPLLYPEEFNFETTTITKYPGQPLGIVMASVNKSNYDAVIIAQVQKTCNAQGIELRKGDFVVAIDGVPISTMLDAKMLLKSKGRTDEILFTIGKAKFSYYNESSGSSPSSPEEPTQKKPQKTISTKIIKFSVTKSESNTIGVLVSVAENEVIVAHVKLHSIVAGKLRVNDRIVEINDKFISTQEVLKEVVDGVQPHDTLHFKIERPTTAQQILHNRNIVRSAEQNINQDLHRHT